uniref:Zinc finger Ran-binding domain-containing protein 2 n=1 Tax=Panagrolaimus sp. JU765 TaxID=591449 RepID=A0AC34QD92_9BILA
MDTNYDFRKSAKSGGWTCAGLKCHYVNPENAPYCESCGAEKVQKKKFNPEAGKDGTEKFKGVFTGDDWTCTKCGNVNWARRQICNLCNARRNADAEQRTGYGGGFMDRQEVEYKEKTADVDEDFDEFGRKKRKTNFGYDKPLEKKQRMDEDENDEDDDDTNLDKYKLLSDEDDDNEIDEDELAKYDLTADPEVVENKDKVISKFEKAKSASPQSSDCSCSCSGGECSCPEEEEEPRRHSRDRDHRSRDYDSRDRHKHRESHHSKSRRRSSSRDRNGRDDRKRSDRDRYRR